MSTAAEMAKIDPTGGDASDGSTRHPRSWGAGDSRSVSPVRKNAMRSVVELNSLEVAARRAAKRISGNGALPQLLRRVAHLDFFSMEDEIGRAIDRAFAEFAREMRK